jgi:hypothetical protein
VVPVNDRDASGVVAPVLEATQPIEQNGRCLSSPDVTDNSAHSFGV